MVSASEHTSRMTANGARAWRAGGGTQKLGRATKFQIPTKLSTSIHPD